MVNVYFEGGRYARYEGKKVGDINSHNETLNLAKDDFMLIGAIGINHINIRTASLDAKFATIDNNSLFFIIENSKAEYINNANWIWLSNSSLSNSSVNELRADSGNNTIDGVVSVKKVEFSDGALTIAKNGVLKVSDKNALKFENISGEGKVFDEKTQAYYNTDGVALNDAKDTLAADIIKYNFTIAKEIKEQKEGYKNAYVDASEQQDENVELLNTQMINSDGLV